MPTLPSVPPGLTPSEFGQRLWGTGPEDARERLNNITREDIVRLGLTRDLVRQWRDFYQLQAKRGRGLPTSLVRIQLLDKCLELLD
jgi:hypothetical protein